MKSVSECLNFIDSMILCNIEKNDGIGNLKMFLIIWLKMYNEK